MLVDPKASHQGDQGDQGNQGYLRRPASPHRLGMCGVYV